jgi:ribose 5-phosphate isomerase A
LNMDVAKRAAGRKAAEFIENGMVVGLGTGSTAVYFIDRLIERCKEGLQIRAVASSKASAERARLGGIQVFDLNQVPCVDITVDGADEIDPLKRMIKGGGGAHVREKILAAASREMVVVIDETKRVASVGVGKLPVEIIAYGSESTQRWLAKAGYKGQWRITSNGSPFITDNGNWIFDLHFSAPPKSPEEEHATLLQIPGVVDTGFFFHLAGRVLTGYSNGSVELS